MKYTPDQSASSLKANPYTLAKLVIHRNFARTHGEGGSTSRRGKDLKPRHRRSYKQLEAENVEFHYCPYDGCDRKYVGPYGPFNLFVHIKNKHSQFLQDQGVTFASSGTKKVINTIKKPADPNQTPCCGKLIVGKPLKGSTTSGAVTQPDALATGIYMASIVPGGMASLPASMASQVPDSMPAQGVSLGQPIDRMVAAQVASPRADSKQAAKKPARSLLIEEQHSRDEILRWCRDSPLSFEYEIDDMAEWDGASSGDDSEDFSEHFSSVPDSPVTEYGESLPEWSVMSKPLDAEALRSSVEALVQGQMSIAPTRCGDSIDFGMDNLMFRSARAMSA